MLRDGIRAYSLTSLHPFEGDARRAALVHGRLHCRGASNLEAAIQAVIEAHEVTAHQAVTGLGTLRDHYAGLSHPSAAMPLHVVPAGAQPDPGPKSVSGASGAAAVGGRAAWAGVQRRVWWW